MRILNRENVLSFALALVVLWFGYMEVKNPSDWVELVPGFLGADRAATLVTIHGIVLILTGLALIFNFKRRIAAVVLSLILLSIVATLYQLGGVNDVLVRDVGLLGAAIALAMKD